MDLHKRVKRENAGCVIPEEELDLLKGILMKCMKELVLLTYGTVRRWLWLTHKQFIWGETLYWRECPCYDEKDLVFIRLTSLETLLLLTRWENVCYQTIVPRGPSTVRVPHFSSMCWKFQSQVEHLQVIFWTPNVTVSGDSLQEVLKAKWGHKDVALI